MTKHLILLLFIGLLVFNGCSSEKKTSKKTDSQYGWTGERIKFFLDDCIGESPVYGLDEKQTEQYCNCVLENTMKKIPKPELYDGNLLPDSLVKEIGSKCYKTIKENQN